MPKDNELACKIMRKLQNRGLVKPGTTRVIVDIDIINGLQQHSFSKDEGQAAKDLIDGVYFLINKYAPPQPPKAPQKIASKSLGNGKK